MPKATQAYHPRIAVVFDFDMTLAPDSYDAVLTESGVDPAQWRREKVRPLAEDGWDTVLARAYALIGLKNSGGKPVTPELMTDVGRRLEPYPGVPEMFGRVRRATHDILPEIEVEFYILTSGFVEVVRTTRIAARFRDIWGSELHYGREGNADFVRQALTHPEKVRYLLQLSKGLGTDGPNAPSAVWRDIPSEEIHVPLDQIVYVGDGASDMPVFDFLNGNGGFAIGVFKSEEARDWPGYEQMFETRRVENLAPADFTEGGELMRSLLLAVESIAKKIALRRLGHGE